MSVSERVRRAILARPRYIYERVQRAKYAYRTGELHPRDILDILIQTLTAVGVMVVFLFPVYWIFLSSISTGSGSIYAAGGFHLIPQNPTLDAYLWVFGNFELPSYNISFHLLGYDIVVTTPGYDVPIDCSRFNGCSKFPTYLWNSLTVAVPAVTIAMTVIVPGAYALSRRSFIFKSKILYGYVLFTQIGGGLSIAILIALYSLFVQAGLTNNKLALATYYAAVAVPFNTWILKTYMDSIPKSYEEAALVDGAPLHRIIWEVIIPLSKPGLAAVFVFTFLVAWKEFVIAQLLLGTENYTLPVGLFSLVGRYSIPWSRFSAFALSFALPVTIAYLSVRRYLQQGLSLGGID